MKIYQLIHIKSKKFFFLVALLGIFSGLVNIGILIFLNNAIRDSLFIQEKGGRALTYIVMIAVSFIVSLLFQNYMVGMTNDVLYELELSIIQKVKNASYETFEKLGSEKLYAAISDARIFNTP